MQCTKRSVGSEVNQEECTKRSACSQFGEERSGSSQLVEDGNSDSGGLDDTLVIIPSS